MSLTRQEKLDAQAIFAADGACEDCGGISRDCPGDCIDVVGRNGTGALVRSCIRRYGNRRTSWESLPLIVLAGLR